MADWKSEVTETMKQLGGSRTTHVIIDSALSSMACPSLAQLDAYYTNNLPGLAGVEMRQHIILCDRCARELLLREQITADLIEDESMDFIKQVYANGKPAAIKLTPRRSSESLVTVLAERKPFVWVASTILLLLFFIFLWARTH